MIRVAANYLRMIATFILGLIIMKQLLKESRELFAVYSIVTVGLGFGVMIREAIRASLVSFLRAGPTDSGEISATQFGQACSLTIRTVLIYLIVSFLLSFTFPLFDLDDAYQEEFGGFVVLRAIGYAFLLIAIPYMNLIAYNSRMIRYNIVLLVERVVDLLMVEVIISVGRNHSEAPELLIGALVYAIACGLLFFVLISDSRRICGSGYKLSLVKLSTQNKRHIRSSLSGAGLLVLTMAFHFRFSLLVINSMFGEAIGVVYAVAVQVAGYLRQAVMGMVTGLDSLYSRRFATGTSNSLYKEVARQAQRNGWLLGSSCAGVVIVMPTLIAWLISSSDTQKAAPAYIILATLLAAGVFVRGLSESWMQYLNSVGRIREYGMPLFVVAILSQCYLFALAFVRPDNVVLWIGSGFFVAMTVSHLIVVPTVFAEQEGGLVASDVRRPVMHTSIVVLSLIVLLLVFRG